MTWPEVDQARRLGAFPTPAALVERVVAATLDGVVVRPAEVVRVVDWACGDGRFLAAVADAVAARGGRTEVVGVDIDPAAVAEARRRLGPAARIVVGDGLDPELRAGLGRFDVAVGNPPFLSPLAADNAAVAAAAVGPRATPYADAAAAFLAVAVASVRPGGRIGLVLPQSILAARDAGPVRAEVDRTTRRVWSWWSDERVFDAQVIVCALVWQRHAESTTEPVADPGAPPAGRPDDGGSNRGVWSDVVTGRLGVPEAYGPDELATDGTIGDRAGGHMAFRHRYYGLVPGVFDAPLDAEPERPLITSGMVDPLRCSWGGHPVRFAGRSWVRPAVDVARLDDDTARWVIDRARPKVVIANQARVVEAVVDRAGTWVPSVPTITMTPEPGVDPAAVAAVVTSAVATITAWHAAAGTGRSATAIRLGPRLIESLPWPAGDLTAALDAVAAGDAVACGRHVQAAFGRSLADAAQSWWEAGVLRRAASRA